jgi:hypothetical protein
MGMKSRRQNATEISGVSGKVDQHSQWRSGRLQIRSDLGIVRFTQACNGFEFEDDSAIDEQVKAVSSNSVAFIMNQDDFFVLDRNAVFRSAINSECRYTFSRNPGPNV